VNHNCVEGFVRYTGPRSFLQQRLLFDQVKGTEDVAILIEPSKLPGFVLKKESKKEGE